MCCLLTIFCMDISLISKVMDVCTGVWLCGLCMLALPHLPHLSRGIEYMLFIILIYVLLILYVFVLFIILRLDRAVSQSGLVLIHAYSVYVSMM